MAKVYAELNDELISVISSQKIFFVATAPRDGHINLSPRGLDVFRVLDNRTVGWLDLTGSGNETAAHLLDDGRITIMFCRFDDKPMILRLYGRGESIQPGDSQWRELHSRFTPRAGTRQIFRVTISRVQTSCGFGVPLFDHVSDRTILQDWAETKGEDAVHAYQQEKNLVSIDGLPTGLARA